MRILMITIACFLLLSNLKGQPQDFTYYNDLTYQYYVNKDWANLAQMVRVAINRGYDSYYLRMRLGIAYYEMARFRRAWPQFDAALQFDDQSPDALKYLYGSMIQGGMHMAAKMTGVNNGKQLFGQDLHGFNLVDHLYAEVNGGMSGNTAPSNSLFYGHIGLGTRLLPRLRLYNGYSGLYQPFQDTFFTEQSAYSPYEIVQHEYLQTLTFLMGFRWKLIESFHKQWVSQPETTGQNWVAGLGLSFDGTYMALGGTYYRGSINGLWISQMSGKLTFYPFANLNLYGGASVNALLDMDEDPVSYTLMLGGRVMEKWWLEGAYTKGPLINVVEDNGFYLYNNINPINWRTRITMRCHSERGHEWGVSYLMNSREYGEPGVAYTMHSILLHFSLHSEK